MKRRIFISTNNDKYQSPLRGLFNESDYDAIRKLPIYNTLAFPDECNILYYDRNGESFGSNIIDTDIILIRDSLTALPENIRINEGADFLLHHNQTDAHLNYIKPLFEYKTNGHHTPNESNHYLPVFKTIFDDNIPPVDKVENILEVLGFGEKQKKLEVNIQLYKALNLLPIKLKETWKEPCFISEIKALENRHSLKLAKDKLEAIFFKEDIEEYYKQLEAIEIEIINLSTARQ